MKPIILRGFFLIIFLIILVSLVGFARGYRLNFEKGGLTSTGILVANSFPDGAKIYVDGKLMGATKSNITLPPGKYDIEFKKDGYSSWKRNLILKGELIVRTDALLFPQNPSLSPVTSLGISFAKTSPTGNKIIMITDNEDAEKNGVYLLDNTRGTFVINPLKLIALKSAFPIELDPQKINIKFSVDEKQILFEVGDDVVGRNTYLLSTDELTTSPLEITGSKESIETAWEEERQKNIKKILETFKEPLASVASDSFKIIQFSPDESKIFYQASRNTNLPLIINPPLVAVNQTPETRTIKKDGLYVYDSKEDKNYLIETVSTKGGSPARRDNIAWFPDSRHLIVREKDHISVIDYDGQNNQTVYSGPFEKNFFATRPDEKLLILTNLNPQSNKLPDLYAVGIR